MMIRFTVVWHQDALDQLADLWLEVTDRLAVTRATDAIDTNLSTNAHLKGNLTGDGLRVLHEPPLRVLFGVSEPDRMVKIVFIST